MAFTAVLLAGIREVARTSDPPLEGQVHEALLLYSASAPALAGAEAELANRCLARHGVRALMAAGSMVPPGPFVTEYQPVEPAVTVSPQETAALFGPPDAAQASVSDPGGRTLSTSTEGCLSTARVALYGSIRTFLVVQATRQWLTNVWERAIADALAEKVLRRPLHRWRECAVSRGMPPSVRLDDVYEAAHLPLPRHAPSGGFQGERYCRVASAIMEHLADAIDVDETLHMDPADLWQFSTLVRRTAAGAADIVRRS